MAPSRQFAAMQQYSALSSTLPADVAQRDLPVRRIIQKPRLAHVCRHRKQGLGQPAKPSLFGCHGRRGLSTGIESEAHSRNLRTQLKALLMPPPAWVLREGQKSASIHARSGVIWGIPAINPWAGMKLAGWGLI